MTIKLTAALAVLGAATAQANATPITASTSITLNQLLQGGSTTLGFNINSQLAATGHSHNDIQSADLVVYGYSDIQYSNPQSYSDGYQFIGYSGHTAWGTAYANQYVPGYCYYSYSWWSGSHSYCYSGYSYTYSYNYSYNVTDYNYRQDITVSHVDNVADTMTVKAGHSSASDTADTVYDSTLGWSNSYFDHQIGTNENGYAFYYDRTRDSYSAIYGDLQTSLHLDADALKDLTSDGLIDALVTASVGGFRLTSATLTVVADHVVAPASGSVPEPGTLALVGIAAAGGVAARRRGKKQQ